MQKQIRILVLADSPTAATGFAQVSRNILNRLAKDPKYYIDVIGINYAGDPYDSEKFPYKIYPAMPQGYIDMFGRDRLISALAGKQQGLTGPWDIIFTIQDHFIIEGMGVRYPFAQQVMVTRELWKRTVSPNMWFKWIAYFPVDAPVKENWVTKSVMLPDYPVAYCNYGRKELLKYGDKDVEINFNLKMEDSGDNKKGTIIAKPLQDRMSVIPHGVDFNDFYVLSKKEIKEFRKGYWSGQVKDDTYLVVNISRNQPRKDIPRTMMAFAEFKKQVPNSHLYLHMQNSDVGGTIDEYARIFGLKPGEDYSLPHGFDAGQGYSIDIVNKIYNAANLCITTTLGEGWGFVSSESMATKTPLVAPNITSFEDILGAGYHAPGELNKWLGDGGWDKVRGIPVEAGSTDSEWVCFGASDNERIRPLTNVKDLVDKMVWAYKNPKKVEAIVERAYKWVQDYGWESIVEKWVDLIDKAYAELETERQLASRFDKANRNAPCPCGSGLKFKKCHGDKDKIGQIKDLIQ